MLVGEMNSAHAIRLIHLASVLELPLAFSLAFSSS
jgi:hypothetical protein